MATKSASLTRPLAFGCAIASAAALWAVSQSAPALTPSLRSDGLFGDWRTVRPAALYNDADYAYEIGFAYLQADLLFAEATEPQGELATVETAADRANAAIQYLRRSVEASPGNARAWSALAWAHALAGETGASRAALLTSWSLAPHNTYLATQRLPLYQLLLSETGGADLADFARIDARDLKTKRPTYFRQAFADAPEITGLISLD